MQCLDDMVHSFNKGDECKETKLTALLNKLGELTPSTSVDPTKLSPQDLDSLCLTFRFVAQEFVRQWAAGTSATGLESALIHLNRAVMFSQSGKCLTTTGRDRNHTLLPIHCLLDRARVFLLTKHYYELAAADYLATLFYISKRHSPDARVSTLEQLREKLTYNTALAFRLAGSFSRAEGIIYSAYNVNPIGDGFTEKLNTFPSRLRAILEIFRMVRAIDSANDLMAGILMLGTAVPEMANDSKKMASALGLVQLCTQYFLAMKLVDRLNATEEKDEALLAEIVCDECVAAVTGGEVTKVKSCLIDGIPNQIIGASKLVRHAFVTVMDFCTSFPTLGLWSSAKTEVQSSNISMDPSSSELEWSPTAFPLFPPTCGIHDIDGMLIPLMLEEFDADERSAIIVDDLLDPAQLGILPTEGVFSEAQQGNRINVSQSLGAEDGSGSAQVTTGSQWKDAVRVFLPLVSGLIEYSPALDEGQRIALHQHLPIECQSLNWHCSYSTKEHGVSLNTLLTNTLDLEPVLLVASTATNLIGAFIPSSLQVTTRFSGRGGTFVFTFPSTSDEEGKGLQVFRWAERNDYFVMIKPSSGISIGGGATGSAILLHPDLFTGNSYPCATFSSPPLSPTHEGTGFEIYRVDVYSFPQE